MSFKTPNIKIEKQIKCISKEKDQRTNADIKLLSKNTKIGKMVYLEKIVDSKSDILCN